MKISLWMIYKKYSRVVVSRLAVPIRSTLEFCTF